MPRRSRTTCRTSTPRISASSRRSPWWWLVIALSVPAVLDAQGVRVSGSIVRRTGGHDQALPGALVVLHLISEEGAAATDSTRTDRAGRFRFARAAADTTGRLVITVRHDGVAYVSD